MRNSMFIAIAAAIPLLALANDDTAESNGASVQAIIDSVQLSIPAKQVVRDAPRYPRHELSRGREAWVHVTYCIDESGSVQNVSILDSIGNDAFDEAALNTVQKWKFEPALQEGMPAWQSRNEVYISFAIEGEKHAASRKFVRQFRKIGKLIEAKNFESADALFWKTYNTYDLSLYELGKLWAQRVRIDAMQGDFYRLDMALERATASHGDWIEKDSYVQLLKIRTQVQIQLGKYHAAMLSFDDLIEATSEAADEVASLRPAIDQLRSIIESDQVLKIPAEVRTRGDCTYCNSSWDFTPVRDAFTFANINGTLTSVDMRCDHKRLESEVAGVVEWHIPEKWGTCHIQVYGEPGTTFDVIMLSEDQT